MKEHTFFKRLRKRSNWELHCLIYRCRENLVSDNSKHDKEYYRLLIAKYENELVDRLRNKSVNH